MAWASSAGAGSSVVAAATTELPAPAEDAHATPAPARKVTPLTDLQQAYVVGRTGADPVGCHIYRELEIPAVDAARVVAGWHGLVDRHEAVSYTHLTLPTKRIV